MRIGQRERVIREAHEERTHASQLVVIQWLCS